MLMIMAPVCLQAQSANSKGGVLKGGLRFQKTQKLYWENGFTIDYTHQKLYDERIHVGVSYATSRLGSALGSNALRQDNFLISPAFYFRHRKQLQPFARLNAGFFMADYENEIFDVLPNTSMLLSLDAGLSYELKLPLTFNLSAGYNVISGSGSAGPGTLFPFYYQLSIYYTLFK